MLKWMAKCRLNYADGVTIWMLSASFYRGAYVTVAIVMVVGVLISVYLEKTYGEHR